MTDKSDAPPAETGRPTMRAPDPSLAKKFRQESRSFLRRKAAMKGESAPTFAEPAAPVSPPEIPVKEVLADGTLVNMTSKEAAKWRKSIKTKIRK